MRWGMAALALWTVGVPLGASAQGGGGPDQVYEPLVRQAEEDLAQGRFALAQARASVALRHVNADSDAGRRARRVDDDAKAQVADGQPAPSADTVYEPLVAAAERDAVSGDRSLALARLSAALAGLPAESPLAERARNLITLIAQGERTQGPLPSPQPAPPAPPPVLPPPPTVHVNPDAPLVPTALQPPGPEPDRRGTGELAELYGTAFALGTYMGTYGLVIADADDMLPYLFVPVLAGTAATIVVMGMDGHGGMPAGIPAAVSMGTWLGLGEGLLLLGALQDDLHSPEAGLSLILASTMAGAFVGTGFGYGFRPTVQESRFVGVAGLWGAWVAWMSALAFDWNSSSRTWSIATVGYNVAVASAMLWSATSDVQWGSVLRISGMGAAGALLGLMVAGTLHAEASRDDRTRPAEMVAASLAIGSGVGLALGILIDRIEAGRGSQAQAESGTTTALADVMVNVAPMPGGGMVSATMPL